MSDLEIKFTKEAEMFRTFGYEELTRKALLRCVNKKVFGLTDKVIIVDAEPSKRVFIRNERGDEFTIRYNILSQDENQYIAEFTVYEFISDGDGTSHGEDIGRGRAVVKYVKEV